MSFSFSNQVVEPRVFSVEVVKFEAALETVNSLIFSEASSIVLLISALRRDTVVSTSSVV